MQLSPNFHVSEFAISASHPDLAWEVPPNLLPNAYYIANAILQPWRDRLGLPIKILSGFRTHLLNAKVGGSKTSQHTLAQAADCTVPDVYSWFTQWLDDREFVPCGQVIYYPDRQFLHVATPSARYPKPIFFVSKGDDYIPVRSRIDL